MSFFPKLVSNWLIRLSQFIHESRDPELSVVLNDIMEVTLAKTTEGQALAMNALLCLLPISVARH